MSVACLLYTSELNRNIQKANRLIREIRAQIGKLKEWIADLFKARETAPEQPPQSPNLANLLMKYLSVQREKSRKYSQRWQQQHTADELKTIAAAVNYLSEHGISNPVSYTHLDVYKRQAICNAKVSSQVKEPLLTR